MSSAETNRLPERGSDGIPILTTTSQLVACSLPWRLVGGQHVRTVVVKATYDIVVGGPVVLRDEPDMPTGDEHVSDDLNSSALHSSDFAVLKPRCDVLLKGHAHPPSRSSKAMMVRFRFGESERGGFDRQLAIFGPRTIGPLGTGKPQIFERIPLTYEHAFGGKDRAENPVGINPKSGHAPNIEDPERLIKSPDDHPEPVGFGAIPMLWKQRWSKLGSYDERWLEESFPYFPPDVDWSFFQAAPPQQQLDTINGDESFLLGGMHPECSPQNRRGRQTISITCGRMTDSSAMWT